jgi:hypothetical protein
MGCDSTGKQTLRFLEIGLKREEVSIVTPRISVPKGFEGRS